VEAPTRDGLAHTNVPSRTICARAGAINHVEWRSQHSAVGTSNDRMHGRASRAVIASAPTGWLPGDSI